MRRYGLILGGAVVLAVVALAIGAQALGPNTEADDGLPAIDSSQDFALPEGSATPNIGIAAGGTQTLYFFPLDRNVTTTVIFLANTSLTATATVYRTYYRSDGSVVASGGTIIPPGDATMRASDDTTAANLVWNFTDATKYVKLVMPDSVVVDGYVAYKSLTSKFDIDVSTNMRPLQFIPVP